MNLDQLLAAQHAAYEADLEPDNYGLDTCPFDLDPITPWDDTDIAMPCNHCHATDPCPCIDRGSPFPTGW